MSLRIRFLAAIGACALGAAISLPASAAPSDRATLAGSVPAWATSANFKTAVAATGSIGFRVYLGWNNPSAVGAPPPPGLDPAGPSYGQDLPPQQVRQQFPPSHRARHPGQTG